jgi:hypothetical protein
MQLRAAPRKWVTVPQFRGLPRDRGCASLMPEEDAPDVC